MPNFIFTKVFVLTGLLLLLSTLITPTSVLASHKIFQDNFDDGDANGWVVTRNPCFFNGLPAEWKVVNGELGIKINGGGCVTEIMPNDGLWNSLGDNYSLEFDTHLVSGTDHNFAFRYTDPDHWYDYHIQSHGALIMQRMLPPEGGSNNILGDFSNGQTIHFKIVVNGDSVKLYRGTVPPILIYDNSKMGGAFPTGRIALQASAGAVPDSETYFDNIVVTNIDDDNILTVPYFSQNAPPWGPSEYDHAISLGFSNTTMNRWGCAVTSAAMVLNYHGMTKFQDNSLINPGTLNQWLKTHKGYLTGGSGSGAYSYISWPAISKLTKDLFIASKSAVILEHKRATPSAKTTILLNDDLLTKKIPDILYVKNASTSGHFVVAKGKLENTYAINDPEWNVPTLSSFNNSYMQVDRYIPSNTNLSYIVLVVNPEVEILVTDFLGNKTGKHVVDGEVEEFNEIPDATYAFQNPINNPDDQQNPDYLGTGVNEFLLPESPDGNYSITLSSNTNTNYTINLASYENNGDNTVDKLEGTITQNMDDVLNLYYSQTQLSLVNRAAVSFQSTIDDINKARSLNLIDSDRLANQLIRIINQALAYHQAGNFEMTLRKLDHFEDTINRRREIGISETAYQILLYDVSYLKTHL